MVITIVKVRILYDQDRDTFVSIAAHFASVTAVVKVPTSIRRPDVRIMQTVSWSYGLVSLKDCVRLNYMLVLCRVVERLELRYSTVNLRIALSSEQHSAEK